MNCTSMESNNGNLRISNHGTNISERAARLLRLGGWDLFFRVRPVVCVSHQHRWIPQSSYALCMAQASRPLILAAVTRDRYQIPKYPCAWLCYHCPCAMVSGRSVLGFLACYRYPLHSFSFQRIPLGCQGRPIDGWCTCSRSPSRDASLQALQTQSKTFPPRDNEAQIAYPTMTSSTSSRRMKRVPGRATALVRALAHSPLRGSEADNISSTLT